MAGDSDPLASVRDEIDNVDDQLLELLNRRARLVEHVAKHKRASGGPFHVPSRERAIIERLRTNNSGPFPDDAIRPVMQEVISACLSMQKGVRVAFLGPEGTFTHLAVRRHFGSSALAVPVGTIGGVFDAVDRAQADFGVVPVENSTEGVVSHTLDSFVESDLRIYAELTVEVSHCLMARPDVNEADIERVYSHPQALAQCRGWLTDNMTRVARIESASTSDAARAAQSDARGAAIASELAARLYDLKVVRAGIQDLSENTTRFLVIAPTAAPPSADGQDKTTLLLGLRDEPGCLYKVLKPLSDGDINLTKIESRPSRRRRWEYVFFIDLQGHSEDSQIAPVLAEVAGACDLFKVLGSYRGALLR